MNEASLSHPEENRSVAGFTFWTPPEAYVLRVGPEQRPVPLPRIPLPLWRADYVNGTPADDAIGQGLYDYLRRLPGAANAARYAEILKEAFPHFLTDLAAQIIMINEKEVDAPFLQRKIVGLRILLLLEPDNAGLHSLLGESCREIGLMFSECAHSRQHFLTAMQALQRSLDLRPENPAALNQLAQLDFWFADYPAALRRWRALSGMIAHPATRELLAAQIARLEEGAVPDHPLVEDLEAIGAAMQLLAAGDAAQALVLLERLEEEGSAVAELPNPEFFHLLAVCRERTGDVAGAFAAFARALSLDATYVPALQGRDRLAERSSS